MPKLPDRLSIYGLCYQNEKIINFSVKIQMMLILLQQLMSLYKKINSNILCFLIALEINYRVEVMVFFSYQKTFPPAKYSQQVATRFSPCCCCQ